MPLQVEEDRRRKSEFRIVLLDFRHSKDLRELSLLGVAEVVNQATAVVF